MIVGVQIIILTSTIHDVDAQIQRWEPCLLPEMLNRRVGLEAMTAAHDWFDRVITGPLVARVREGDGAGAAVAARLGYAQLRVVEDGTGPVLLLRRNSPPVR